jgi:ribose transport system substrate-binding protein
MRRNRYQRACSRSRGLPISAVVVSAALAASGCGSSSSSNSGASTSPAGGSAQTSSGVAYANAQVARYSGTVKSFPAPGPPLKKVASLRGKTVYYVPITLEDPEFSIVAGALKTAMGKVGVNVVACSGGANPSGISSCLGRAVAAKAAGVITDAIPVVEAANAFRAVQAAGIPILVTDQLQPPSGLPGAVHGLGNDKVGYLPGNGIPPLSVIADWVIAHSNGKANVLITVFVDNVSSQIYVTKGAIPEFQKHCPGCKVYLSKALNANFNLIPSQTSSALLSHPGVNYVIPEYDAAVEPVLGGVQQSGFATKVTGASTTGLLGALQQIKAKHFLAADMGTSFPYQGWADADASLRQMLGMPVVPENIPMRLFTAANIDSVTLTPAAQASGEWYGGSGYQAMFSKLWGV